MRIAKIILKWIFAGIFIAAGILHFAVPESFTRIMPPVLPYPLFWVYLSGVGEIVLGAMLLIPQYSRSAAWGSAVLLIAVFPANIYMAINPQLFSDILPAVLYLRLPLQFILIGWAYWLTKDNANRQTARVNLKT